MRKTLIKMIRNGVMLGLHNAKYDIDKTFPGDVVGGLLVYNANDYGRAYFNAETLLCSMRLKKDELPISKKELKKYVNVRIAEMSFQDAENMLRFNKRLGYPIDRTDKQLLKECEDALIMIEENGIDYSNKYDTYYQIYIKLKNK